MPYYEQRRGGFLSGIPTVTRNLLIVNIVMFIATLVNEEFMVGTFAMFYPASPFFRVWQPVTYMFMHGGFWHIFFNMYTLLMFGTAVERTIGTRNFLILYFVTGLGAMALHTGVEYLQASHYLAAGTPAGQVSYNQLLRTPMLGASGAIYGLLVAYAMLFPDARMTLLFPPVTLDAKWRVIIFIGIELLTGVTGTGMGIAHFAHLGGALLGFILIWAWRKSGRLWRR